MTIWAVDTEWGGGMAQSGGTVKSRPANGTALEKLDDLSDALFTFPIGNTNLKMFEHNDPILESG